MIKKGMSLPLILLYLIVTVSTIFFFNNCGKNSSGTKDSQPQDKKTKITQTQNPVSVSFKKVLQTEGSDETFYFKYPKRIYTDSEDNVYILDSNRLLRFSKDGSYTGNLVTAGQGPGEVTNISGLCLTEEEMIIHNNYPSKIIRLDKTGKFLKEYSYDNSEMISFILIYNNGFYFLDSAISPTSPGNGYEEVDENLSMAPDGGKEREKIHAFPVRKYVVKNGGSVGSFGIAQFHYAVFEERFLFVSHTVDYKIKCFDLKEKKIIREFGVEYQRQEIPEKLSARFNAGGIGLSGKLFRKPVQKYFNDIHRLLIHDKNLWVVTSEVDKNKGVRVDVYDIEGKYLGRFDLRLPGSTDMYSFKWTISGDYLYSLEKDKEDNPVVIKYQIIH